MGTIKKIENNSYKKHRYCYPVSPSKASNIETDTMGEFCKHLPKYEKQLNFVTLEDVLGGQESFNHVLLNPRLSKEKNEQILRKAHHFHFPKIDITEDDLDMLTSFDKYHLDDFIVAYRELLERR
jgi:hypothetical protein